MKKKFLILAIIFSCFFTLKVNAIEIDYIKYKSLDIMHGYIIGEYIFDVANGPSPTLKDILEASRSIPEGKPTTLYEIMDVSYPGYSYFYQKNVYNNNSVIEIENDENAVKQSFIKFDAKYVYTGHLGSDNYKLIK